MDGGQKYYSTSSETPSKEFGFNDPNGDNKMKLDKIISNIHEYGILSNDLNITNTNNDKQELRYSFTNTKFPLVILSPTAVPITYFSI